MVIIKSPGRASSRVVTFLQPVILVKLASPCKSLPPSCRARAHWKGLSLGQALPAVQCSQLPSGKTTWARQWAKPVCQALAQACEVGVRQARVSPLLAALLRAEETSYDAARTDGSSVGAWGQDWCGPALLSGGGLDRCVEGLWQRRADAAGALQAQGLMGCGLRLRDNRRKGVLNTHVAGRATCQEGVCSPLMSLGPTPAAWERFGGSLRRASGF